VNVAAKRVLEAEPVTAAGALAKLRFLAENMSAFDMGGRRRPPFFALSR